MNVIRYGFVVIILQFITVFSYAQSQYSSDSLRISLSQQSETGFKVEITNTSQDVIPIAEPLYGLATSSLYFILEDSSGAQMIFVNKDVTPVPPREFTRGMQSCLKTVTLHPGKSFITEVDLDSGDWFWPATLSIDSILKIRVCYNYPRTESGYWWSGRIVSSPIEWDLPMELYAAHIMHLYE